MVSKLVERSPLNYKIVAAVSALDPSYIISGKVNAEKKFKNLVKILYERDLITFIVADNAKLQFCSLSSAAHLKLNERFENFSENDSRPDDFYYDVIGQDKSYKDPWFVIKIVLIFSHGQASVESGFSINSSIIVENLHEESLVAQRLVYDSGFFVFVFNWYSLHARLNSRYEAWSYKKKKCKKVKAYKKSN